MNYYLIIFMTLNLGGGDKSSLLTLGHMVMSDMAVASLFSGIHCHACVGPIFQSMHVM